jgi:hypothetical protein
MIITNLKGGLGNQMFQYATGLSLAREKNTTHKVETEHFKNNTDFKKETERVFELDFFNTKYEIASKEEILSVKYPYPLISKVLVLMNSYLLAHNYIKLPLTLNKGSKDIYLDGYFQSENYFKKYSEKIREEFTLNSKLLTKDFHHILKLINDSKGNSTSVHLRRGDYITNVHANKHHGVLEDSYYINALELIRKMAKDSKLFVFSDDIEWVKKNLDFLDKSSIFVSEFKFNSAQEITLMSKCQNNIIANSSFSWWGAWLNQNKEKIVIAPKNWLKNGDGRNKQIVPGDWLRI